MITVYPAPELNGQEVVVSEVGCPMCQAEGNTNVSGNIPRLRFLPSAPREPFCVGHPRHRLRGNLFA
jgi:hypothetical protein